MAFGPILKLKTGDVRIELAPLDKGSLGEFIDLGQGGGMQSLSVTRYISRQTAPVLEDEYEWFERTRQAEDSLLWGIWVINGDERVLIGNTVIFKIGGVGSTPLMRQAVTASLIFRQDYWGRGIASAVHKARTWYAFNYLGVHCLQSDVLQPNVASRKALERSGYTFVYTKRNEQYGNGVFMHLDRLECVNPIDVFLESMVA